MATPRRRLPRLTARRVSRDTILFAFGLGGIGWQQFTGKVYEPLLVVFGLMVGLPGVQVLAELLPGRGGRAREPDTASTPSSSPSPPSSSPSPPTSGR